LHLQTEPVGLENALFYFRRIIKMQIILNNKTYVAGTVKARMFREAIELYPKKWPA